MSVLVSSNRSCSGLYDFAVAGGAIGSINLGVFLPGLSITKRFLIKPITTATSTGAATISFTLVGATVTTVLFVPTGFAAFTANSVIAGVDFNANPFVITEPSQVVMNIGAAVLTAGKISFILDYNENSI